MEELKEYNGVSLTASEVEILEQLEKLIAKEIPCRTDRDEIKRNYAEQRRQSGQSQSNQASTATILAQQAQAIKAQMMQQERLAQLSLEELEKTYEGQYMAQANPVMKANIQAQLNALIPMYGENHPSVQQMKELLEMDESKAKEKAKGMALFMQQNFKLQSINKEATERIQGVMTTPIPLEELENECINYYNSIITPEYQEQLKITLSIGMQQLGANDPTLAGLIPLKGLNKETALQAAEQYAQSIYQNIQNILAQYGVQMQSSQANIEDEIKKYEDSISAQPAKLDAFGFISDNNHVISLNISSQALVSIPDSVCGLTHLRYLSLKWNELDNLPENIGNLINLEEIDLDGTWSTNDDKPLYNNIKSFPDSICNLSNLKILRCNENGLKTLPENIGKLRNLKELLLYKNKITFIPESFDELQNLETLEINGNDIEIFSPAICMCSSIKILKIGRNKINNIPECIDRLDSLTQLFLDGNDLEELPSALFNLKSLDYLGLSYNKLSELPEDIKKLNVSTLWLNNNLFENLPYHIWEIDSLKNIKLDGNPLSPEELEVAEGDTEGLKKYCRQRASIQIMLVSTEEDAVNHRISDIVEFLEKQSEVFGVISGDLSNIDSTDLILFLATAGTVGTQECLQILEKGKELGISIVPLKGLNIGWGDLATIGLSRELGIEFALDDFEGFCTAVYDYIKLLKRKHNIFKDKSGLIRRKVGEEAAAGTFEGFKDKLAQILHSEDIEGFFNMFQAYLKPQYDAIKQTKLAGLKSFIQTLGTYYMTYLQQKGGL